MAEGITYGLTALAPQVPDGNSQEYQAQLQEILRTVRLAEQLGYDSVWTTEHHFTGDGHVPAPFVLLAAIAAVTREVRIGTNIVQAPLWDPVRLGEEAALADQLSAGRLLLGLGLGYRHREFEGFGLRRSDRGARMQACLEYLRDLWSPAGERGPGEQAAGPPPLRRGGPPVWIGAIAEPSVRRAGRMAAGYLAPPLSPRGVRRRLAWLAEERSLDGFAVAICVSGFVADADPWERARPGVSYSEDQYNRWMVESGDVPGLRRFDAESLDGPPDHVVCGTPDEVAARLAPYREVLDELPPGCERHLLLRLTYPGVAPEHNADSVRLFAREVAPALGLASRAQPTVGGQVAGQLAGEVHSA